MFLARALQFGLLLCFAFGASATTLAQGGGSPPANPAIAFVEIGGNSTKLSVMNADGARKTAIYTTSAILLNPCWSPSGASICFGIQVAGGAGLAVLDVQVVSGNVVASNFRMLVSGNWTRSAWAPDGAKIAFSNSRYPGIWSIPTSPTSGGMPTQLYAGSADVNWLAWSRNSQRIAFSILTSARTELRVLDTTVSGSDFLVCSGNNINQVDWGRTGDSIVFEETTSGNGRYVYRVDATAGANPSLVASAAWGPTWSPDDSKIAYSTGSQRIVVRNLSTGSVSSTGAKGSSANWRRF